MTSSTASLNPYHEPRGAPAAQQGGRATPEVGPRPSARSTGLEEGRGCPPPTAYADGYGRGAEGGPQPLDHPPRQPAVSGQNQLRGQQRLAAAQHPGLQRRPRLPTRHRGRAPAPLAQAHVSLRLAQHADPAVPACRPGGAAGPHSWQAGPAAHGQPDHRGPVHADHSTPCRLIYFRIGG